MPSPIRVGPGGAGAPRALRRLAKIVEGLDLTGEGVLIDLGCSDGFVVSQLRDARLVPEGWSIWGYDRNARLIRAAAGRNLPRAQFSLIDLNDGSARVAQPGDVVNCLETLEHVGDYRAALQVIHHAIAPGGRLVLSMPNEVGLVGLVKFLGRPLVRPNAYKGFFGDPTYRHPLCARRGAEAELGALPPATSPRLGASPGVRLPRGPATHRRALRWVLACGSHNGCTGLLSARTASW